MRHGARDNKQELTKLLWKCGKSTNYTQYIIKMWKIYHLYPVYYKNAEKSTIYTQYIIKMREIYHLYPVP